MAHAKTAFICLALLAAAWAVTEVQELGNDDSHLDNHESANLSAEDDDDSVGEAAGTGRRGGGGFLSTAGSFTLSSGNADNTSLGGEEDELGEGMGRRGGGGFLSTQGSFSLSSGNADNTSSGGEEE